MISHPASADIDSDVLNVFMRQVPGATASHSGTLSRQLEIAANDPTLSLLFTVRNWDNLRADTQTTLGRYIHVSNWENGKRTVSATASFTTCEAAVPEASSETMDSSHFKAVYTTNTGSTHRSTTSYITDLLEEAETSWTKEITTIGFPQPKLVADNKLRIFVCNLLGSADGILGRTWTTTVNNSDDTAQTFIELDNDYAEMTLPSPASEYAGLVFSHEFFHAIQFGINYAAPSYWLLESNATWIEDEVYPDSNDYITQYVRSRFNVLDKPIDYFSFNDIYGYGASIFFRHITENIANVSFMTNLWSTLKSTCLLSQTSPQWKSWCQESITETPLVDSTLQGYGTDIEDTFRDFSVANYTKDYIDGTLSNFPSVPVSTITMSNDSASVTGELDHLATKFYKLNYSIGSSQNAPVLSFSGSTGADWRITAILETQGGIKTVAHKTLSYGNYSGTLNSLGVTDNSVVLIVNNTHLSTDDASFTIGVHNAPVLSQAGTVLPDRTITTGNTEVVAHIAQILTNKTGTITGMTYSNSGNTPVNKQLTWTIYRDTNSDGVINNADTKLADTSTLNESTVVFTGLNEQITAGQSYTYLLSLTVQSVQSASMPGAWIALLVLLLFSGGFTVSLKKNHTLAGFIVIVMALSAGTLIYTGCGGGGGGGGGAAAAPETVQMQLTPSNIIMEDSQDVAVSLKGSALFGPLLTLR